jgi:serine/threonine protein kinase
MGRIYLARQEYVDRPVALKIVSANAHDSHYLRRFFLEASILAKIQHPNVVTLFDYGRVEGAARETYFIAMEFLDGETIAARLRVLKPLPCSLTVGLLGQLASGLREAHARGIVHRDVKPSNIVVCSDRDRETAKLVDFGIGKLERGGEKLTRNGALVGTPKYMAPEQFEGCSTTASDIYALGLVTYEMLTGEVPFPAASAAESMLAKLDQPLRPMRTVRPEIDVPRRIEDLVVRMLARHPEDRPSADTIVRELSQPRPPPLPPRATTLSVRPTSTHPVAIDRTLSTASLLATDDAGPRARRLAFGAGIAAVTLALTLGALVPSRRTEAPEPARSFEAAVRRPASAVEHVVLPLEPPVTTEVSVVDAGPPLRPPNRNGGSRLELEIRHHR